MGVKTLCPCAVNYWGLTTSHLVFLMLPSETDPVDPGQRLHGLMGFSWGLQNVGALAIIAKENGHCSFQWIGSHISPLSFQEIRALLLVRALVDFV